MAQYYTDFSGYTTSSAPSDWTARWVTSSVTWSVQEVSGVTGGKVLRGVRTAAARSLLSWDAIDSDSDRATFEILARHRVVSMSGSTQVLGLLGRGSGSAASESGYNGTPTRTGVSQDIGINKYVSGTFSIVQEGEKAWSTGTWYWSRFQGSGTALKLKRWAGDAGDEPGTWDIETTDSSISAAGWLGVMVPSNATNEWDVFAVGTNGDPAPSSPPSGGSTFQKSGTSLVTVIDDLAQASIIKRTIRRTL